MAKKEDAQKAIQEPNPIIDGRKANVNLAYIGAKPRLMQSSFPFKDTESFNDHSSLSSFQSVLVS